MRLRPTLPLWVAKSQLCANVLNERSGVIRLESISRQVSLGHSAHGGILIGGHVATFGGAQRVRRPHVTRLSASDRAHDSAAASDTNRHSCVRSPSRSVPASAHQARHALGGGYTSRQRNTHNTESREVLYPWHPWFGRSVTVYEVLTKCGHAVCRCGLEEQRNRRSLEIPTWMFEPAACRQLHVASTPVVGCNGLLELKALLRAVMHADAAVLVPQHPSLITIGGADATVCEPNATLATDPVSSSPPASAISNIPARHPREGDSTAGARSRWWMKT
jgi:hypothetical protein